MRRRFTWDTSRANRKFSHSLGDPGDPEFHVTDDPHPGSMRFSTNPTRMTVQLRSPQTLLVKAVKWWNLPGRTHLICSAVDVQLSHFLVHDDHPINFCLRLFTLLKWQCSNCFLYSRVNECAIWVNLNTVSYLFCPYCSLRDVDVTSCSFFMLSFHELGNFVWRFDAIWSPQDLRDSPSLTCESCVSKKDLI